MAEKSNYLAFIACVILILSLFFSLIWRPQTDVSEEEMRTLTKVPAFSPATFLSGTYQNQMEEAISDQLLFGKEMKYGVKGWYNRLTMKTSAIASKAVEMKEGEDVRSLAETEVVIIESTDSDIQVQNTVSSAFSETPESNSLQQPAPQPSYTYQEVVAGSIYRLDSSGWLIHKATAPETYDFDTLYSQDMLNAVTRPKYLFFIDTPLSRDFSDFYSYDPFSYIKTQFTMTGYDQLSFTSWEDYKTKFYQTDHHWNHRGSYEGYCRIITMLLGPDEPLLEPTGEHVWPAVYEGSLARDNLLRCATENFTTYDYDLPAMRVFVDDVETEYGWRSWYESDDDFPHKVYSNHYGMYYGDDHAKVVYDTNRPDKPNVLILATSWSNAINDLVASHFNQTHVLDFRHYYRTYGTAIDAESYMQENNIDMLLIMGDISSLGHLKKGAQ